MIGGTRWGITWVDSCLNDDLIPCVKCCTAADAAPATASAMALTTATPPNDLRTSGLAYRRLTPSDVAEAIRRIRHDFAFVGLTDSWNASISLFHAQFGGEILGSELKNTRIPDGSVPGSRESGVHE